MQKKSPLRAWGHPLNEIVWQLQKEREHPVQLPNGGSSESLSTTGTKELGTDFPNLFTLLKTTHAIKYSAQQGHPNLSTSF